ncbi:multisubstrate pseudouridine synthase 7-like [Papaver somniferum]|uniref:multisubstrate pseudouridine synthase 7-like n=1 Tax=Papaver somniferum TaxID=3469 RepID=UPI000E6FFE7A|nr:multisubstrate pseudouridine synthase 7-like [Papaver somniferum]
MSPCKMWINKALTFPVSIGILSHPNLKSCNLLKPCAFKLYCNSSAPKTETLIMPLDETDVGIHCYISQLPGFRGVLKQRYADFIVNEVDTDGNVVRLTSLDAPSESVEEKKEKEEEKETETETETTYTSEIESFRLLAGDTDADLLKDFIHRIRTSGGGKDEISPIVLSPDYDKIHRTAVHNYFKANLKFLVTDTVDGPDSASKCIRVRQHSGGSENGRGSRKRKERGGKPFDSRGTDDWPETLGKFLRFNLFKENKDTQEALGVIGKMLGVQQRAFGFAGTKDKRAITTQRVTVFKQPVKKLASLNGRLIGIKIGDFCYVKEGLFLGQLQGNRFTITLRGVTADSEDTIKAAADSLGRSGFINYFGLQRFGSGSVPTHLVGAALLRGEWKTVVSMILDPREGERDIVKEAREYYKESGDIDGTLRKLPRYLVAETAILQCLKKCPGNYLQALKAIPRTLRMMYVHSYQSYLWNHAASIRVQKHGISQVILGDLVLCKEDSTEKVTEAIITECEDDNPIEAGDSGLLDEISGAAVPEEIVSSVKVVNSEHLLKGEYSIEDIVLPLPGSRVIYPMNDVAEIYHDLAKKDNINLTECVHSSKEFSITSMIGGYRRVFQKPIDFEWELLRYTDVNLPLAETDLDVITKSRKVNIGVEDFTNESSCKNHADNNTKRSEDFKTEYNNDIKDGAEEGLSRMDSICDSQPSQVALKLGLTLPSSCYATMAIRELLKTSTSVAFHKTLNQ